LANDSAEDSGDSLTLTGVQATSVHGAAVTIVSGQAHYDPGNATYFETLANGASATDTFSYTATDNHADTATQTATVTRPIPDRRPASVGTTGTTTVPSTTLFRSLANDSAEDSGDSLTLTGVQATSAHGAAVTIVSGQAHYDPNGAAFFETLANGASTTDTFSY